MGIVNCSMPLFIPYSEFLKEAKHIEGSAPELFKVTAIGEKRHEDPYLLSPTSEIIFRPYFSKNILSYNDLPLILNHLSQYEKYQKDNKKKC